MRALASEKLLRKTSRIRAFEVLPHVTHKIWGGGPNRSRSRTNSLSLLIPGLPRRMEDGEVFRFLEPQITHGMCSNAKRVTDPTCQGGRQLGVNPEDHATTTG